MTQRQQEPKPHTYIKFSLIRNEHLHYALKISHITTSRIKRTYKQQDSNFHYFIFFFKAPAGLKKFVKLSQTHDCRILVQHRLVIKLAKNSSHIKYPISWPYDNTRISVPRRVANKIKLALTTLSFKEDKLARNKTLKNSLGKNFFLQPLPNPY